MLPLPADRHDDVNPSDPDRGVKTPPPYHGIQLRSQNAVASTSVMESRSAALTFASPSGATAVSTATTHLNSRSLIGSGTLINCGLWRDSNQTSIIFVFDSSCTDQRFGAPESLMKTKMKVMTHVSLRKVGGSDLIPDTDMP